MFYLYIQNNSGALIKSPAPYVIVRADSSDEADEKAESVGVYFGWEAGDCPCCGQRWGTPYTTTEAPEIYGNGLEIPNLDEKYVGENFVYVP